VVIVGVVAWYAYRKIERTNVEARGHERQVHADALQNMRQAYERVIEAQAEEIARLGKELKDETRKLAKVITELNGRLNS
jgi:signal transduction histidine kinase